jgi:hypothetical protein
MSVIHPSNCFVTCGACVRLLAGCKDSPENPANGTFNCFDTTPPGETCSASCFEGFQGPMTATCGASGVWGNIQGTCEPLTCPAGSAGITCIQCLKGSTSPGGPASRNLTCTSCEPGFTTVGAAAVDASDCTGGLLDGRFPKAVL